MGAIAFGVAHQAAAKQESCLLPRAMPCIAEIRPEPVKTRGPAARMRRLLTEIAGRFPGG
jgi:hypothetical protein